MDKHCIYEIVSPSGKKYIGRTRNFNKRMTEHKCHCSDRNDKRKFYDVIFKYGWDNFEKNIIEYVDSETEAIEREKYYITKFDTVNNGYNHNDETSYGGDTWSNLDQKRQEKISQHRSNIMTGNGNPMYGKKHSKSSIEKQKEKAKGRFSLPWYIDRYGESDGKKLYEERCEKLRNRKLPKGKDGKFVKK